ncbi:MAG: archaeosortase/exosortase family protein [Chitinophagales bacterium]|nr:archaeosortase/exosortase family protein [Chitinophagales bacterium]
MTTQATQRITTFLNNWSYPIIFVGVYVLWKVVDILIVPAAFVQPYWQAMVASLSHIYQLCIGGLLTLFGYKIVYAGTDTIMLGPKSGVIIKEHCLAISASFIFGFTAMLLKSKTLSGKLAFAVGGVLFIFIINVIRLATYTVMHTHMPRWFSKFFHNYGYVIIMYGLILLMLKWWIDRQESFAAKSSLRQ